METSKQLFGFVELYGGRYSYLYEQEELTIFSQSEDEWLDLRQKISVHIHHLDAIKAQDRKWDRGIQILGKNQFGKNVFFEVSEFFSLKANFVSSKVNVCCIYSDDIEWNDVDGLVLSSADIDNYFCPNELFHFNMSDSLDGKIAVSYGWKDKNVVLEWGMCQFKDYKAKLSVQPSFTYSLGSNIPIVARGEMLVEFENKENFSTAVNCIRDVQRFFHYVTCRKNIDQIKAELFWKNEQGMHIRGGEFIFIRTLGLPAETDKKSCSRIIKKQCLCGREAELMAQISTKSVSLEHIWNSIADSRTHGIERWILLFTSFDREFMQIYGQDYGRDPLYIEVKKNICELLQNEQENKSGKERRYFKSILSSVQKLDMSLSNRIKRAFNDCIDIMKPFLALEYNPDNTKEVVDEIASRMNALRNDMVHGNFAVNIEPIYITDIKVIEMLLYAMRLKSIGVDTKSVQCAISDLFDLGILVN